jgi:mRNA interferase RelE/StbE
VGRYSVLLKPSAIKEIESIPLKKERQRVLDRIRRLSEDPRPPGCRKLSDQENYRIRQGRYRIVYTVRDQDPIVEVVRVGDRKEVYR